MASTSVVAGVENEVAVETVGKRKQKNLMTRNGRHVHEQTTGSDCEGSLARTTKSLVSKNSRKVTDSKLSRTTQTSKSKDNKQRMTSKDAVAANKSKTGNLHEQTEDVSKSMAVLTVTDKAEANDKNNVRRSEAGNVSVNGLETQIKNLSLNDNQQLLERGPDRNGTQNNVHQSKPYDKSAVQSSQKDDMMTAYDMDKFIDSVIRGDPSDPSTTAPSNVQPGQDCISDGLYNNQCQYASAGFATDNYYQTVGLNNHLLNGQVPTTNQDPSMLYGYPPATSSVQTAQMMPSGDGLPSVPILLPCSVPAQQVIYRQNFIPIQVPHNTFHQPYPALVNYGMSTETNNGYQYQVACQPMNHPFLSPVNTGGGYSVLVSASNEISGSQYTGPAVNNNLNYSSGNQEQPAVSPEEEYGNNGRDPSIPKVVPDEIFTEPETNNKNEKRKNKDGKPSSKKKTTSTRKGKKKSIKSTPDRQISATSNASSSLDVPQPDTASPSDADNSQTLSEFNPNTSPQMTCNEKFEDAMLVIADNLQEDYIAHRRKKSSSRTPEEEELDGIFSVDHSSTANDVSNPCSIPTHQLPNPSSALDSHNLNTFGRTNNCAQGINATQQESQPVTTHLAPFSQSGSDTSQIPTSLQVQETLAQKQNSLVSQNKLSPEQPNAQRSPDVEPPMTTHLHPVCHQSSFVVSPQNCQHVTHTATLTPNSMTPYPSGQDTTLSQMTQTEQCVQQAPPSQVPAGCSSVIQNVAPQSTVYQTQVYVDVRNATAHSVVQNQMGPAPQNLTQPEFNCGVNGFHKDGNLISHHLKMTTAGLTGAGQPVGTSHLSLIMSRYKHILPKPNTS